MRAIIRMPQSLFEAIKTEITEYAIKGQETFMFMFVVQHFTNDRLLYLARSVVLPDSEEAIRTPVRTRPDKEFRHNIYASIRADRYFESNIRLAAIHSHPFQSEVVEFSKIDMDSFRSDQKIYNKSFNVEFLGIVFNKDITAFDGLIIYPYGFRPVDELQIVGKTFQRIIRCEGNIGKECNNDGTESSGFISKDAANPRLGL